MRTRQFVAIVVGSLSAAPAFAHHSLAAPYETDKRIEVRGHLTAVSWQNPHVLMTVDADGVRWQVEAQAKNLLERTDIDAGMFVVGQRIAVMGFPARRGKGVFALNALLVGGREVILRTGFPLHFGGRPAGNHATLLEEGVRADPEAQASGLFRVWSMQFAGPGRWTWPGRYPLTPQAAAARERFDPEQDFPIGDCTEKGMPWIMDQPFPIELTRQGDHILLKLEEVDAVRTIHLRNPTPARIQPSIYGYSVGRFDGEALIVRTTAITARYLNARGIPLSPAVTLDERFGVSPDGSRLNYTLTVTDPATFTKPITLQKYWIWRPGVTLKPYGCATENGQP